MFSAVSVVSDFTDVHIQSNQFLTFPVCPVLVHIVILYYMQKAEQYVAEVRNLTPEMLSSNSLTYDLPRHTVTVTEIDGVNLTNAGGAYLGRNVVG